MSASLALLPRYIRCRDAPDYLGMDRNRFKREVRPSLTEIPIGEQGIAFDRLDLDAWADDYKRRNGRPGQSQGEKTWDKEECQASSKEETPGTSINTSKGNVFAKAVAQVTKPKQSDT